MAVRNRTTSTAQSRGDETRGRILQAALRIFGEVGYAQATTRRIAESAGVALPAIKYYFDNKEGLYLACAHEILARYEASVGPYLEEVATAFAVGMSAEEARGHLKRVMRAVTTINNDEDEGSVRTGFVLREMTEQGPAFGILYRDLWRPGVNLTAHLIARIEEKRAPNADTRVKALLLHASFTAFSATRPVSKRYLAPTESVREGLERALTVIEAQIDGFGK
jgi:TetR/AcrR family transcriptional regulator, regulator of cefoperazone and chloramphenicol sensitivity